MDNICPNCQYIEVENKIKNSSVRIFSKIKSCASCIIIEERDKINNQKFELDKVKQEIINKLNELDKKVIRALLDNETERIEEIKLQKIELRNELNNLKGD